MSVSQKQSYSGLYSPSWTIIFHLPNSQWTYSSWPLSYNGVGGNGFEFLQCKNNVTKYFTTKQKKKTSLSGFLFTYLDIWLGAWVHAFFFQALLTKGLDLIENEQYLKNIACSIIKIMFGFFQFCQIVS